MPDQDPTSTEEQVRRLLADARHDEPMPADIAARLDGVLADLQAEPRRTSAPVDLAARRRRRIARNALVAAAAVVVVGLGISRVDLGSGGDDASSGSTAADAPESSALQSRPDAGGDVQSPYRLPLLLDSKDFHRKVRRSVPEGFAGDLAAQGPAWCDSPAWGAGERIPVRYDGRRGVLVLRPPTDVARAADLFLCGDTVPTRSATIPAG